MRAETQFAESIGTDFHQDRHIWQEVAQPIVTLFRELLLPLETWRRALAHLRNGSKLEVRAGGHSK